MSGLNEKRNEKRSQQFTPPTHLIGLLYPGHGLVGKGECKLPVHLSQHKIISMCIISRHKYADPNVVGVVDTGKSLNISANYNQSFK